MKHSTIALAAAALFALGACNSEQEAANAVNGSIGNAVLPVENGAAAATTNAAGGDKPVDTGAAGTDSAAPAGDKPPADANAAEEAPAGDKPQ